MQGDFFPDDPRRDTGPSIRDRETTLLKYAEGRERGITLHGVTRDVFPHRAEAAYLIGSLARKGLISNSGKVRGGCIVYILSNEGRCLLSVHN